MPKGKTGTRDDDRPSKMAIGDQADLKELIAFKELALSNMWGIAALIEVLERKGTLTRQEILKLPIAAAKLMRTVADVYRKTDSYIDVLHKVNEERVLMLQKGDELPPGVIKVAAARDTSRASR